MSAPGNLRVLAMVTRVWSYTWTVQLDRSQFLNCSSGLLIHGQQRYRNCNIIPFVCSVCDLRTRHHSFRLSQPILPPFAFKNKSLWLLLVGEDWCQLSCPCCVDWCQGAPVGMVTLDTPIRMLPTSLCSLFTLDPLALQPHMAT